MTAPDPVGPLPPGALEPLVEIRVVEHHPVARVEWPVEGFGIPGLGVAGDAMRILQRHGEVVLADFRGQRGPAAALLRRLADELDHPLLVVQTPPARFAALCQETLGHPTGHGDLGLYGTYADCERALDAHLAAHPSCAGLVRPLDVDGAG